MLGCYCGCRDRGWVVLETWMRVKVWGNFKENKNRISGAFIKVGGARAGRGILS